MPLTADQRRDEAFRILNDSGAILANDHFVYISGDHGSGWIDKDRIFVHVERLDRLAQLLAEALADLPVDYLCGPATGGLMVAQWTARHLNRPAVFAEYEAHPDDHALRGRFALRRGYDQLLAGQQVVVVDDVVNTGHSLRETAEAVRRAGGTVVAGAAFVDRGNLGASLAEAARNLGVPEYRYLLQYQIPDWPAASCELCRRGVPINTRYAHGQDFLDSQLRRDP